MADIKVTGWVQDWNKTGDAHRPTMMRFAEQHGKADGDTPRARTFWTVKVSRASGIDLTAYKPGDMVTITGNQITEVREWQGAKRYDLILWADSVDWKKKTDSWAAAPATAVNDDMPF